MNNETAPFLAAKKSDTTDKGRLRAIEILQLAREIFSAEGYAALSMRGLATRIGVSLSTVQHYYASKERLVEAMLLHALDVYQTGVDEILESMRDALPEERFAATLEMFLDDAEDPVSNGMFFELWALANRHGFASEILATLQTRARKTIRRMIRDLDKGLSSDQCELRAALIVAQFQGLMPIIGKRRPVHRDLAGLRREAHAAMMAMATDPIMRPH
jgi:AcrR family transcriptional regulator